jgi:hypothetical protein
MELQHAVEELKSLDIFESIEVELDEGTLNYWKKTVKKTDHVYNVHICSKKWKKK